MTTGTKLKLIREKKKLSQEELAHAVGVTQTTICNWEHGKSIKHEYITKLAEALEVPIDFLLVTRFSNTATTQTLEKGNNSNTFEFIFKAPDNFFEDLNKKIDFLVTKFNQT
jgi:transcriptional regulator with XRE-family HTH domain